ncbi:hypothetical protein J4466_05385 [Candidatus Pacearchaeota archaeon]|nr:hypothetical protein [Candidatus Pacearchaeota archaeon]
MVVHYQIYLGSNQSNLLTKFSLKDGQHTIDFYKDFGWSESKRKEVLKSLYGIVGIYQLSEGAINKFYIPEQLLPSFREARKNKSVFEGSFEDLDLEVLEAIYVKNSELRKKYGLNWNPRFHKKEVARLSNRNETSAVESLDRLVGILGIVNIQDYLHKTWNSRKSASKIWTVNYYAKRWFLPSARIPDVERVLRE